MLTDSEQLATIMSRQIEDRQRAALEQANEGLRRVMETERARPSEEVG